MGEAVKPCPQCQDLIPADANFCSFCRCDVRRAAPVAAVPAMIAPPRPAAGGSSKTLIIVICLVAGFFLVGVVGIVAAIAIPGFVQAQRKANERNAWAVLRSLATAEADCRSNDRDGNQENDFWVRDVRSLYFLESYGSQIKLIEQSVADADGAHSTPLPKAGYLFRTLRFDENGAPYDLQGTGRNLGRYGFCAYPAEYGSKAKLTFIVNQDNTVWKKDTGGAPVEQYPANPWGDGWAKDD